jgi:hypothetical protein
VDDLSTYLKHIVEPTFEDFKRSPGSGRHAFLACLATYHAVDRATYPKRPGNRLKEWRRESVEFAVVEIVANQFKHVKADEGPPQEDRLPLSFVVFGKNEVERNATDEAGYKMETRNLCFAVQDAIKFLHTKAKAAES